MDCATGTSFGFGKWCWTVPMALPRHCLFWPQTQTLIPLTAMVLWVRWRIFWQTRVWSILCPGPLVGGLRRMPIRPANPIWTQPTGPTVRRAICGCPMFCHLRHGVLYPAQVSFGPRLIPRMPRY